MKKTLKVWLVDWKDNMRGSTVIEESQLENMDIITDIHGNKYSRDDFQIKEEIRWCNDCNTIPGLQCCNHSIESCNLN